MEQFESDIKDMILGQIKQLADFIDPLNQEQSLNTEVSKPPLGIMPKFLWEEKLTQYEQSEVERVSLSFEHVLNAHGKALFSELASSLARLSIYQTRYDEIQACLSRHSKTSFAFCSNKQHLEYQAELTELSTTIFNQQEVCVNNRTKVIRFLIQEMSSHISLAIEKRKLEKALDQVHTKFLTMKNFRDA